MIDESPNARLDRWKQSLLDLSPANRLLDARDSRTTIPLPDVDPVRLAFALATGAAFAFVPAAGANVTGASTASSAFDSSRHQIALPAPGFDSTRLVVPLPATELTRRLTTIRRAARAQLADGGVHALQLALGLLTWCDADGAAHSAPLWLLPVELERGAGGSMRLIAAPGRAPRFNATLGEKLRRDFDLVLDPGADLDVAALLEVAAGVALTRTGWRVERAARLGLFSAARFEMWRDVEARTAPLVEHPLLAWIAGGAAALTPLPAASVSTAPPSDLLAPLDADTSQLTAIAAAGAGASFVLQGAPGTGKSQTIANLIVHCVSQGKTVLFASDKVAALEVVHQRLAAIGLGELALPLHAGAESRAHVLAALGRVLERSFRPGAGLTGNDARLAELRTGLDAYVAALHARGPFGRSVYDALARLVELRTTPRAALADADSAGLDRATFDRRLAAVAQLATTALPIEPVSAHPWRVSTLVTWPAAAPARAVAALDEAAAATRALQVAVADTEALVRGLIARTPAQLRALGELAAVAAASPRPGAEWLTQARGGRGDELGERIALIRARGGGAIETPRDPTAFVAIATRQRALAAEVDASFTATVADLDVATTWAQLRRWTGSVAPLRFVALRTARAEVRAVALPGALDDDARAIIALEAVIAERACRAALTAAAEPARRWFGALGADPLALDLAAIDDAVTWASELRRTFEAVAVAGGEPGRQAAWRALVAQVAANPGARSPTALLDRATANAADAGELAVFARVAAAVARWSPASAELAAATGIEPGALGAGDDHLAALREQVDTLRGAADSLAAWVAFHAARHAARAAGVEAAIGAIARGDLGAAELADAWERATLLEWADAEIAAVPALADFHGASHHAQIAAFADLDRGALALSRARALVRLADRMPRAMSRHVSGAHRLTFGAGARDAAATPQGLDGGDLSPEGSAAEGRRGMLEQAELELLRAELRAPHGRGVRALLAALPTVWPRIAPCVLMTPAAIADYLEPGARFDVVVFDEAQQLPIEHALGALARGGSAVVVGDARQVPPTAHAAGAAVADEPEAPPPASLLDHAVASRLPGLALAWHYRSRHEDLIAFAAQRFYDARLQVLPAAAASAELGIAWRKVDGVFDRVGSRHNRVEADAVVADVLARLRDPAQRGRSLAVVTLGRAQAELIEDLLDAARAADPALDRFFAPRADADAELEHDSISVGTDLGPAAAEPVVVAHVDALGGDERDVVLLSIGYGPDTDGRVAPVLPALAKAATARRLAVATTRAREQLIVVSSLSPDDLPETTDATAHDVRDLRALLAFARAGGGAARPLDAEAEPASAVTAAIARALGERGWTLRHRVGCGAYTIDLAVLDPNDPERYVLAIEADGTAYATAAGARDRDRLRAQVLGQLGWRMHRIWALDWWADADAEIARAHGAIIAAIAASRQRRAPAVATPRPVRPAQLSTAATRARPATQLPSRRAAARRATEPGAGVRMAAGSAPIARASDVAVTPAIALGSGPASAIPEALAGAPTDATPSPLASPTSSAPVPSQLLPLSGPLRLPRGAIAIGPYTTAAIPAGRRQPDDLFAPRHLAELGKVIEQVLAAEAPMHVDLLARRVGAYFGIGRVTQRVTDQVSVALAGRGRWGDEHGMIWRLDQDPTAMPAVRVAGSGPEAKRDIAEVPLSELAAAARIVVERAAGIATTDLVRDAARLLGFARITDRVLERVGLGMQIAAQRELIRIDRGTATMPPTATGNAADR